jgi:hypothetical protein
MAMVTFTLPAAISQLPIFTRPFLFGFCYRLGAPGLCGRSRQQLT